MSIFARPKLVLHATPARFRVVGPAGVVEAAPILWYDAAGEVVGHGASAPPGAGFRRLELFPAGPTNGYVAPFFDPLAHFLARLFSLACVGELRLNPRRPDVAVAHVDGFATVLDGDAAGLLQRAAREAGARRVVEERTTVGA